MAKYYRIGEMADSFGISTDTLRLYDRMGILPARKDSLNNYRYYDRSDFITLGQIVCLRRCGVPLDQVRELVCGGTPVLGQSLMRAYHDQLRVRIAELETLAQSVEDRCLMGETTMSNLGQVSLVTSPRYLIYPCEEKVSEATRRLTALAPGAIPVFSFLLPRETLATLDEEKLRTFLSLPPEQWNVRNAMLIRDFYGIPDEAVTEPMMVFPARRYLFCGALCVQGKDYSQLKAITDTARERGLRIAGDLLIVVISLRNGPDWDRDSYQLWLPVE